MSKADSKDSISKKLAELERIVQWFQEQEELDVEAGLEKVKLGAVLVRELKEKLKKTENEFEEIKKELNE